VIDGPGAFVLVAQDFNSFGNLLIKKLIAEIALIEPRGEFCLDRSESVAFCYDVLDAIGTKRPITL